MLYAYREDDARSQNDRLPTPYAVSVRLTERSSSQLDNCSGEGKGKARAVLCREWIEQGIKACPHRWNGGTEMRTTVMLMVALAASPALAEAQDLTDCLAADPGDQREDVVDGHVFWDIDLRNNCTEEVHAYWYYYSPFARDPAFPMRRYTQPVVRPGNLIRVTLSWEIAEYGRQPPTPVIAWCGHRAYADFARCRGSNDYELGSRVNWREWPAR